MSARRIQRESYSNSLLIVIVLCLIVSGQVFSKVGAISANRGFLGLNGYLLAAYGMFVSRGVLWSWVLRKMPLTRAYPLTALAYPLILLAGVFLFQDRPAPTQILGTLLIGAGSALIVGQGSPEDRS